MIRTNNLPCRAAGGGLRRRLFVSCALVALVVALAPSAEVQAGALQAALSERITTATGVRVRNEPDTKDTDELARLPLGVVVQVLERSDSKQKVGATEDYWYLISAPGGVRGWVFGGLTAPFESARRAEVYRKLAADRLANSATTFAEMTDLVRFVERVAKEVTQREALAELELARVQALARSLASIPFQDLEKEPYKSWTNERAQEIVYSEPAGQWYVNSELFWNLQKKYRDLPVGERAAWAGAQTPLPGECEGYLPCYFASEVMTTGHYLKLYPRGPHAAEVLDGIAEMLEGVSEDLKRADPVYHVPAEDRGDFQKTVVELRSVVTPAAHPKRTRILTLLDEVARRFR